MTAKERIEKILSHEEADIVPWHISFTQEAYRKMAVYYQDEKFIEKIGNHFSFYVLNLPYQQVEENHWRDEFGVVWNRGVDKDVGVVEKFVVNKSNADEYRFPDPYDKRRFADLEDFILGNKDKFIICELGFSLFERACILRGMENLLVDMKANPGFVDGLLDRILEYNLVIIEQACSYNIDCFHFADDWAQQQGLIMGPELWRKFIKPRVARMCGEVTERGKVVSVHCCGDVREIFPDLIEIGVKIFNPLQPEVMDVFEVKDKFGDKLTFHGGIGVQQTLPFGTIDEVIDDVKKKMERLGKGGGYVVSPAHAIPPDVPAENMAALIDSLLNQSINKVNNHG